MVFSLLQGVIFFAIIILMIDFAKARQEMVEKQLKSRDIVDERVLQVMNQVPREEFVPPDKRKLAYNDGPLLIGQSQTISQPYIVALMTQLLELKGREKVLEVGTGSGYQAAILAGLTREVFTIERHQELLAKARKVFKKLKIKKIRAKVSDGSQGWQEKAPFEAIIVTAAAEDIPQALIEQLADGGRLVIPVGKGYYQQLIRLMKKGKRIEKENFGGCAFVPLITES